MYNSKQQQIALIYCCFFRYNRIKLIAYIVTFNVSMPCWLVMRTNTCFAATLAVNTLLTLLFDNKRAAL